MTAPDQQSTELVGGCTRSHPHENMSVECELRAEIARLRSDLAIQTVNAKTVTDLQERNRRLMDALRKCALVLAGEAPNKSALIAALEASRRALDVTGSADTRRANP